MPQVCQVCKDPQRSLIDGLLDDGQTMTEVAGRTSHSRSAIGRHAQHRSDKAVQARALAQLSRPKPSPEEVRRTFGSAPIAKLHDRLVELAQQSGRVAEAAIASHDARLFLSAIRTEAAQLHKLADRFPVPPQEMLGEGRDLALAVVGRVLRARITDHDLLTEVAGEINTTLIAEGVE